MRVFVIGAGTCTQSEVPADAALPDGTIWIDLLNPTEAERATVQDRLGIALPTVQEMQEIEASARTYSENGVHVMTTTIVARIETEQPEYGALTFVLTDSLLVTLRYLEPKPIEAVMDRLTRLPVTDLRPLDMMITILDAMIGRMADALELVGHRIETLSRRIFNESVRQGGAKASSRHRAQTRGDERREALQRIGAAGDFVAKIRDSLAGVDRLLAFLVAVQPKAGKEARLRIKTGTRDVRSLAQHADFLVQRLTFLLDATIGLISVDQNDIVKTFSVAAAVFLPPTLIASIYGMNFGEMPELTWPWGYPFALGLMAASAILPLWYFRRRGWI